MMRDTERDIETETNLGDPGVVFVCLALMNVAFDILISVLTTEMTANRCCVVTALEICQCPTEAVIIACWFDGAPRFLYHPGNRRDICPPGERNPKAITRLGWSNPSFVSESRSTSLSRPHACRQDMRTWATMRVAFEAGSWTERRLGGGGGRARRWGDPSAGEGGSLSRRGGRGEGVGTAAAAFHWIF